MGQMEVVGAIQRMDLRAQPVCERRATGAELGVRRGIVCPDCFT